MRVDGAQARNLTRAGEYGVYSVNESFGVLQKQGDPYQLQIGTRYEF